MCCCCCLWKGWQKISFITDTLWLELASGLAISGARQGLVLYLQILFSAGTTAARAAMCRTVVEYLKTQMIWIVISATPQPEYTQVRCDDGSPMSTAH